MADDFDGFSVLREAADRAVEWPPEPPPDDDDSDPPATEPGLYDPLCLPDECPVVPLGVQGQTCYYLDELGQLQSLAWKEHSRLNIEGLFGRRVGLLRDIWPKLDDKGQVKGWRPEDAAQTLKAAAARQGVWSPTERVRGAGSWLGGDGELILHFGDRIGIFPAQAGGATHIIRPGMRDGYVYPTRPSILRPVKASEPANGVGAMILAILKTWNWARPDIDPYLALGWLVAGILGGAIDWRPLIWVTGGRGSGKSTLNKILKLLLGPLLVSTSDASAAGVWQKVGYDSRPVAIDEAESGEDNRRMNSLLALARQAASGGLVLRGGADHQGHEFTARSPFSFFSIGIPPLLSQDRSRMAILQLKKLKRGARPPAMTPRQADEMARRLLRRVVDGWPRFAETLARYREAMEDGGHEARGADVFGTLLACMDLALFDLPPDSDTQKEWSEALRVENLAELADDVAVENACLMHMLTKPVSAYRGGQAYTVGQWVRFAAETSTDLDQAASDANSVLRTFGMEVRDAPVDRDTRMPRWPGKFLYVAYRHAGTASLFERTDWQGRPGAVGGWVQHLSWLPDVHTRVSFWCGSQDKAVLIPLDYCLIGPPTGGNDDSSAAGSAPVEDAAAE